MEPGLLLSLFCGAGGLDTGFETAGFEVGLAYDRRADAVRSYNANRMNGVAHVADVTELKLGDLDVHFGSRFVATGVIGGPPCQSFSRANHSRSLDDPRAKLVATFITICLRLHRRQPLDFVVMENVPELITADGGRLLAKQECRLQDAGFLTKVETLNAVDFGVPQNRRRMFLVALNRQRYTLPWSKPEAVVDRPKTVGDLIKDLPTPALFERSLDRADIPFHPNHWCMTPKSARFFDGTLRPGYSAGRSFKTLDWAKPSLAVSYGNREVHVHPSGTRRLSVYEAMLLQGFPTTYVLEGSMSSQITQVSEAVPPPLAAAVAASLLSSA